jgi:hypothetical protein
LAQPTATFLDELMAAARGCLALLLGWRDAASYFDFSQRGLVGSFIAVVIGIGLTALGPQPLSEPATVTTGAAMTVVIFECLIIGVQFGVAWLVLRQLGRGDGLVPFMVVQNWGILFQAILAEFIIIAFGPPIAIEGDVAQLTNGSLPLGILAIMVFIVAVNVGRLILTLRPLHVALFVGAQFGAMLVIPPLLGSLL